MSGLNPVDAMIIVIFALSMLLGFIKGFLREVISLLSWIAATIVAMTFASPLAAHFGGVSTGLQSAVGTSANVAHSASRVTLGICFVVIFIFTLFVGSIIGYILSGLVARGALGFINRLLGAAFGFLRGIIFVVIFMFVSELTPLGSQAAWAQSQLVLEMQPLVNWFANMVQPGIAALKAKSASALQGATGAAESTYNSAMQSIGH